MKKLHTTEENVISEWSLACFAKFLQSSLLKIHFCKLTKVMPKITTSVFCFQPLMLSPEILTSNTTTEATSPCNIGQQWILMPPTLTSYPAAALLTFSNPNLSGHSPSGPAVAIGQKAVVSLPSVRAASSRLLSCFMPFTVKRNICWIYKIHICT